MLGLRTTVDPRIALEQITTQTDALSQISTSGVGATDLLQNYFRWIETARRGLRSVFDASVVSQLVESDHYWFFRGATDQNIRVIPSIVDELEERARALEELHAEINAERGRWLSDEAYLLVVPDTSMLMSKTPEFAEYDWCVLTATRRWLRMVLPVKVIDELDGFKDRGSDGQRRKARSMIKWLDEHLEVDPRNGKKVTLPNTAAHVTLEVFVAPQRVGADSDMTIIETAKDLAQIADARSVVVTRDLGQTVRGRVADQACVFVPTAVDAH